MNTGELESKVKRLSALNLEIATLETEREAIKEWLRVSVPPGKHDVAGQTLTITRLRRFDADVALKVVPPHLLPLVTLVRVDSARAKAVLTPEQFAACQVESAPAVRISQ